MNHLRKIPKALLLSFGLLFILGCNPSKEPEPAPASTRAAAQEIPETTTDSAAPPTQETQKEEAVMETQPQLLRNPQDSDFVRVRDYIPDVLEELIYATENNFTGKVIYDFQDIYLRYGTVKKLAAVQEDLRALDLRLKIWDGFRPVSAQFKLWEICPDDTYVANPNVGFSNHSRGFAVDLTLVDLHGQELEMPTAFDDFSGKADRNYSDVSELAKNHAELLEILMEKHGFKGYYGEWWHYNDTDRYEVETVFEPGIISQRQILGEDSVSLQSHTGDLISMIPAGEAVTLMGYDSGFALVSWEGLRGYVSRDILSAK